MSNTIIEGSAVVLVTPWSSFDPADPLKTPVSQFVYASDSALDQDGCLTPVWKDYRLVGKAQIRVELNPLDVMLTDAVKALEAERQHVLAEAQKKATRISAEIQRLLAIELVEVAP